MDRDEAEEFVQEIMQDYARQTGLISNDAHPRRYLWTDAFAVCNYLELFRRTGSETYRDLGLRLVEQVHHTLARHRDDDPRHGWISGLGEQEGESHPTMGGLRIGKQLNERRPDEPPNERLEWDQDGQYYHYLTKWMHALNCAARATGDTTYTRWAIELAKTAHGRFTYAPPHSGRKRMYWKMSIDLTRPLVPSMGQHDPLDGFVTYKELEAEAARDFPDSPELDLTPEIADMAKICRGINLPTDDPLGIGGLLFDASRIAQLMTRGAIPKTSLLGLLENVLGSALIGVKAFESSETLAYPAGYRLAFRELGLSIGLAAVEDLAKGIEENPQSGGQLMSSVAELMGYLPLRKKIEQFWMDAKNREANTWIEHHEINMVMLATSLAPGGFLRV